VVDRSVVIQLCKRSLDRLGAGAGSLVSSLRDGEHTVQVRDCMGRCVPCQAGRVVASADGMPLDGANPAALLAMVAELAADE
jgi:hypothetical protein